MKIVFEGNQEEVTAEIVAMALVLTPGTQAWEDAPTTGTPKIEEEEAGAPTAAPERKPGFPAEGKTRRTKAQIEEDEAYFAAQEAEKETPDADIDTSGEGGTANPTLDDVRNKLKMVVSMTSMKRGQELVAEFGASRITELPEEKFAAFIARCEVVVEEG